MNYETVNHPEKKKKITLTPRGVGAIALASASAVLLIEHGAPKLLESAEAATTQPALTYSQEMQTYAQPEALTGTAVDAETAVYNAAQAIDGAEDAGINEVMGDVKESNAAILEDGVVTDGEIFQIPESVTRE